jgi:hypothetical protein
MIELLLVWLVLVAVIFICGKLETIEKKIDNLPQITEKENKERNNECI